MSSIVVSGDTSGAITIAAPAVAGTNTLTLPAATGTILTTASTVVVTQAMLSTNVASNGPAFCAYNSADQSISSATWTKVTLNTEEFDTNSNFASSRFTPTVAGYYQIDGTICLTGSTITNALTAIYKNGSQYLRGFQASLTSGNSNAFIGGLATIVYMNGSTDYLELYGYITAGSPAFASGLAYTHLSGALIRSA